MQVVRLSVSDSDQINTPYQGNEEIQFRRRMEFNELACQYIREYCPPEETLLYLNGFYAVPLLSRYLDDYRSMSCYHLLLSKRLEATGEIEPYSGVIKEYEQQTASFNERVAAANQIARAGYPLGFIIAPLFIYPGYQADYAALFEQLSLALNPRPERLSFELITHRFTARAKNIIRERFPGTRLDLDETGRRRKYGRYGLVKYIYSQSDYSELQKNILAALGRFFPKAEIEYFT